MLTASWCPPPSPPCSVISLNYHCVFKHPMRCLHQFLCEYLSLKKRLKDCILKYVIFLGWYWNLGFKWKIPVVLLCQERRMIVLVVTADVLTGSYFYMWGQSCSKGLISQTFSLPMLLLCFYSITCTITDRWGLLSKDKAGVISPPGLAWHTDHFWELYSFSELNSDKSKISSLKLACFPPRRSISSFGPVEIYKTDSKHTYLKICSTSLNLNPWHTPCALNSSAKLR